MITSIDNRVILDLDYAEIFFKYKATTEKDGHKLSLNPLLVDECLVYGHELVPIRIADGKNDFVQCLSSETCFCQLCGRIIVDNKFLQEA
jgi:hypothetical protein